MQPPHPQREGQVTKFPAIFGFLPSMKNISKNPVYFVFTLHFGMKIFWYQSLDMQKMPRTCRRFSGIIFEG